MNINVNEQVRDDAAAYACASVTVMRAFASLLPTN